MLERGRRLGETVRHAFRFEGFRRRDRCRDIHTGPRRRQRLTHPHITTGSAQVAAGYSYVFPGEPRMYGLDARVKF